MSDSVQALARSIVNRKRAGREPYVLILGAGASLSSGCKSYPELIDAFLQQYCPDDLARLERKHPASARRAAKLDRFHKEWRALGPTNRFAFLKQHLSGSPSSGYEHLAWIVRQGYTRLILSTNLDNQIEQAFTSANLAPNQDYEPITNGRGAAAHVIARLRAPDPRIKVVKLHGTLTEEDSYAWLPEEVFEFEEQLADVLGPHVNGDVIVLGNRMDDRDLDLSFRRDGGEIWFVNPSGVEDSRFRMVLNARAASHVLQGETARFDGFLAALRSAVEGAEAGADRPHAAPAIHRFLMSIGLSEQINVPRSRYLHLPDLYVKPREYGQILRTLDKRHAVVIAGEPHMGKTYTALHILWERFQQGWSVKHMPREALAWELQNCRHSTDEFAARHLGPKCLVHLDDPFGEIEYEPLGALQKEFAHLIQDTQRRKDCGLIVTSRLGVFSEAFRNMEGADLLRAMGVEADIRVHTSYSQDTLRQVLEHYVSLYKPSWASNEELKQRVLRQVPKIIEAPHNLELFARRSEGLTTEKQLLDSARECREVIPAIRDWILRLPLEEQLALLLVGRFSQDLPAYAPTTPADLREIHRAALADAYGHRLVEGIRGAAWESGLENLRDVVSLSGEDPRSHLSFVHPSYAEALDGALERSPLLRDLLLAAARFAIGPAAGEVLRAAAASALPGHADILGGDGAALLVQLKTDRSRLVRRTLAGALARDFRCQDYLGRKMIAAFAIDRSAEVRADLGSWLAANYDDLDASACKLVEGLATDPSVRVRYGLVHSLGHHSGRLNASAKRTLRLLADDPVRGVRIELVLSLIENYSDLDASGRKVVLRLTRDTDAAVRRYASSGLAYAYGALDAFGRRVVAARAKDADIGVRESVGLGLAHAWRNLDAAGRRLVAILAHDRAPRVRAHVAGSLAHRWTDLDARGRRLMSALVQDRSAHVRASVAEGLVCPMGWQNLDASGRRLVVALAQDNAIGVRRSLADGLAQSRESLDAHGRKLLADLEKQLRKEAGETIKQAGAQKRKTRQRRNRTVP